MATTNQKFTRTAINLLAVLPDRARVVVERRFGIGGAAERTTLEAVGKTMGITRERVRQIEAAALKRIRESAEYKNAQPALTELRSIIAKSGGIMAESTLFSVVTPAEQHAAQFLLALHESAHRLKEDDTFAHRWTVDQQRAAEVERALQSLHEELKTEEEPLDEEDLKIRLARHCKQHVRALAGGSPAAGNSGAAPSIAVEATPTGQTLQNWIALSLRIGQNTLGEWGLTSSPHIHPRGVRDLSYVVMKRHGSPMHFTEVAAAVKKHLGREAHVQTVHNELIKDDRFVLVGRGLYALKEWGYQQGTVRDIIKTILREVSRPLPKPELLKRILKERHVKESTILINLQNKRHFRRLADGSYTLA